jgi:hypothetical protein
MIILSTQFKGFEVLAAVVVEVAIFWDTAPCSVHIQTRSTISKKVATVRDKGTPG